MEYEAVYPREPKVAFLLADSFKNPAKNHREKGLDGLKEEYEELRLELMLSAESELDSRFRDKVRLKRYDSMDWYKGEVSLESMGVWPEMQKLEIDLTIGNILDTANGVQEVIEKKSKLYVPERFLRKLDSMKQISEFVYPRFPLILFPGGEVREKDRNEHLRRNNIQSPECKIFDYDIDDGCSRAVLYALNGISAAPAYVGKYK